MGKIQVIFKKEDIRPDDLEGKVAVVFDVLFATSTITAALADGAAAVIPVFDAEQARKKAAVMKEPFLLAGEDQGKGIEGFHPPLRTHLKPHIKNHHLILSTTNGTVALHRARRAKRLYAASLLNNPAMAEHLVRLHGEDTIVIICSGSSGHFTLEDFYGAGSLITYMEQEGVWTLSDAAIAARDFYNSKGTARAEVLLECRIGQMLLSEGLNPEEVEFVAEEGHFDTIPTYDAEEAVLKEGRHAASKI
ncbi:UNVERIFIED_CONTAM: 2-phosphosulfolactate phosphatase [Halobacillus marinus]